MEIDGRVFRLPYLGEVRPLTPQERQRLRESIEEEGRVRAPVVIDEQDNVIDGANRMQIAAELGFSLERITLHVEEGLTWEEKQALAWKLNEVRRQLSPAELEEARRQRIERVAAARSEGKSTRQIAEEEGVSQMQVRRDLEAGETPVSPGAVKGKDGKQYRARKKPAASSQTSTGDAAPLTDEVGVTVPEHLAEVFKSREDFDKLLSLLTQSAEVLNRLRTKDLGITQQAMNDRDNLYHAIKHAYPFAVCPACQGAGELSGKPCDLCRKKGWLVEGVYQRHKEANRR